MLVRFDGQHLAVPRFGRRCNDLRACCFRRDRRTLSLDDDTPAMTELRRNLASAAPDPESIACGSETADRLARAVAVLGAKDRLLVELHLVRGMPLPVVADMLGVTPNAAYVRKSRVLDRLRRSLEESA